MNREPEQRYTYCHLFDDDISKRDHWLLHKLYNTIAINLSLLSENSLSNKISKQLKMRKNISAEGSVTTLQHLFFFVLFLFQEKHNLSMCIKQRPRWPWKETNQPKQMNGLCLSFSWQFLETSLKVCKFDLAIYSHSTMFLFGLGKVKGRKKVTVTTKTIYVILLPVFPQFTRLSKTKKCRRQRDITFSVPQQCGCHSGIPDW